MYVHYRLDIKEVSDLPWSIVADGERIKVIFIIGSQTKETVSVEVNQGAAQFDAKSKNA